MEKYMINLLCLVMYVYALFQTVQITKGKEKNSIFIGIVVTITAVSTWLGYSCIGFTLVTGCVFLFALFYAEEPLVGKRMRILIPGMILVVGNMFIQVSKSIVDELFLLGILALALFYLLSSQRGYLNKVNGTIVTVMYLFGLLVHAVMMSKGTMLFTQKSYVQVVNYGVLLYFLLLFLLQELTLRAYQIGYEQSTSSFQNRLMHQQYEEIRSVYMNMRGWRHDYHNHIQVLKAHMDKHQIEQARAYLGEIETELNRVETFVRSGNMMADAILNSKLTLAMEKNIRITCDASLTEELFISDIDLCIILGNVLDNAIESCEKIAEEERFLRIYLAMIKEQLYISIQNAAPEMLNFEERHYISTKRGNHGLGMKRVAAVVEKREGFLNLNNEPGIFGTEITIPKPVAQV